MADRNRRKASSPDKPARPRAATPPSSPAPASPAPAQTEPQKWDVWFQQLRRWMLLIGIVVAVGAGSIFGLSSALLVLTATLLLVGISAMWSSMQLLAGDSSESAHDVVLLAAPGTEYEQKQAVLRALKDLEFERAVGKISEEDYQDLRERYREKARAVLQNLDRELEPVRAEAEKLAAEYLKSRGIEPGVEPAADPPQDKAAADDAPAAAAAPAEKTPSPAEAASRNCRACSVVNDADAAFCKKCGQRLDDAPRAEAGAEP
jgi:hypothetical protein